jgi:hypothetical protein
MALAGSIPDDDDDCDHDQCRDQRKRAIERFRSGLCDMVERGHQLGQVGDCTSPTSQPTSPDFVGSDAIAIFST